MNDKTEDEGADTERPTEKQERNGAGFPSCKDPAQRRERGWVRKGW